MNKKSFAKLMAVLLIAFMIVPLWGCAKGTSTTGAQKGSDEKVQTEVDKIKAAGKIVVGTSADYPPYEFHAAVNGKDEIVGFDIDIAKEIAKDLGVQLEIKEMKFDGLLAALETGKVDFVIAGMTPDAERRKQVDFSQIYYRAVQGVVVRKDDKDIIKTVNDLSGKTVGVQKGTTQEKIANAQIKGAKVKGLGKVTELVLDLKNKKSDALVMELPVAKAYASKNPDIAVSDIQLIASEDEGGSAVAVKKNSSALLQSIDKTLDRLLQDKSVDKFFAASSDLMNQQ